MEWMTAVLNGFEVEVIIFRTITVVDVCHLGRERAHSNDGAETTGEFMTGDPLFNPFSHVILPYKIIAGRIDTDCRRVHNT